MSKPEDKKNNAEVILNHLVLDLSNVAELIAVDNAVITGYMLVVAYTQVDEARVAFGLAGNPNDVFRSASIAINEFEQQNQLYDKNQDGNLH